jgi:hypothetical protein
MGTMEVRCSETAILSLKQIAARSPTAYVEISTMMKGIRQYGLAGETSIAVLNSRYDIYVLEPASPGVPVVLIADPVTPNRCVIADAGPFSTTSAQQKVHAVNIAASAMGVVVTDIYIVP